MDYLSGIINAPLADFLEAMIDEELDRYSLDDSYQPSSLREGLNIDRFISYLYDQETAEDKGNDGGEDATKQSGPQPTVSSNLLTIPQQPTMSYDDTMIALVQQLF